MNRSNQILPGLSCGGMEIIWRYAWAFFLTVSLLKRPFPLVESSALFMTAYLAARIAGNRNWRVYQSLLLHIVGFTGAWFLIIHRFFYRHIPLLDNSWMADWLKQLQGLHSFLMQLLFFACLLSFWLGARSMAKRENDYNTVCLHFDKGLGALFLLLLVKFTAEQKGGLLLEDPVTRYLLFAYFAFSLIAISLSRNQSDASKTFRPGYHGIGTVLGFLSIVLISGAVLTSLFLPYLTVVADSAQSALKETAEPMYPVFVRIIRYIFSIGRYRRDGSGQISGGSDSQMMPDAEGGWALGFGWVMAGLFVLTALVLCGFMIHQLVRWLLKKNAINRSQPQSMNLLYKVFSMMVAICLGVWNGLLFLIKKVDSAAAIYAGMLRWGRRSGLPAGLTETPIEYGNRLGYRIPELKEEIDVIVQTFCMEVYGNIMIDPALLSRARSARQKMRKPRYWVSRLRGWFVQPG
jgi:Domain of unknown function (DUF4129)